MNNIRKLYKKTPHKTACAFILLFLTLLIGASLGANFLPTGGAVWQNFVTTLSSSLPLIITIIIYMLKYRPDAKHTFRLKSIGFKWVLYFILLGICAWGFSAMLNMPIVLIVSQFGEIPESAIPEMMSAADYLSSVFSIAVMPAIFEELFCRGILMRLYENYGKTAAVIISALLFSIMHNNFINIPSTFFMGVIIAICVMKTGSVLPGMIIHFTVNFTSTTLTYLLSVFEGRSDFLMIQALVMIISAGLFIFVFIPVLKKSAPPVESEPETPPAVIDIDLSDMQKSGEKETIIIEIDDDMPKKVRYGFSVSLCFIILIFIFMQVLLIQMITGA